MLKDRAIFALGPMPKIIETILKLGIDEAKKKDNTDQMAYTKDRGTVLCNAITLQKIE